MAHLYDDLADWYDLVDPREEHADEAADYASAIVDALGREPTGRPTLLELGAGGGHNASYLKASFACTLSDLSPRMLERSGRLNPDCAHVLGDMRTLRLEKTFDAVLIHDAIVYMASEVDLRAALLTAFVHTAPGGVALFAPDSVRETFCEGSELLEEDGDGRALRGVMWTRDPDPEDATYLVDFALILAEGGGTRVVHDAHVEGLFPVATWMRLIEEVGFVPSRVARSEPEAYEGTAYFPEFFLGRRPG